MQPHSLAASLPPSGIIIPINRSTEIPKLVVAEKIPGGFEGAFSFESSRAEGDFFRHSTKSRLYYRYGNPGFFQVSMTVMQIGKWSSLGSVDRACTSFTQPYFPRMSYCAKWYLSRIARKISLTCPDDPMRDKWMGMKDGLFSKAQYWRNTNAKSRVLVVLSP